MMNPKLARLECYCGEDIVFIQSNCLQAVVCKCGEEWCVRHPKRYAASKAEVTRLVHAAYGREQSAEELLV